MTKVMLVEDDDNLREIYGARLIAEGYEIISARDGEEALALAIKEKPDLLISDVMMPKISGFDMLDILRSSTETKNIKVIMMTALSQTEDKDRADKLGADRYLVKSQVTLEDVVKVTKEVLEEAPAPSSETPEPIAPIAGVDLSLPDMGQATTAQPVDDQGSAQTTATTTQPDNTASADATATTDNSATPANDDSNSTTPVTGAPLNTNKEPEDEDKDQIAEQPEPETIKPTVTPEAKESNTEEDAKLEEAKPADEPSPTPVADSIEEEPTSNTAAQANVIQPTQTQAPTTETPAVATTEAPKEPPVEAPSAAPAETATPAPTPAPEAIAPTEATETAPVVAPQDTPTLEAEKTPEEKHKEKKVIQPLGDPSLKVPDINELLEKELEKEQLNNVMQQAGIVTGSMTTPPDQNKPVDQNPNNVSL